MYAINFYIEAKSPILISSNVGDPNMTATQSYIPGSTLRGIFANHFDTKEEFVHNNEDFYNWFLKGDLQVTNAYLTEEYRGKKIRFFPAPYSIHEDIKTGNIVDLLFANEEELPEKSKHKSGFCVFQENYVRYQNVKTSISFHHTRDRKKGSSKDGEIFNYESINPGQYFCGQILGKEETLKSFYEKYKNLKNVYIGRSKYTQYGKASIEWDSDFQSPISSDDLKEEFSITLLSDTIIYNSDGYSCTNIDYLGKYLGVKIKKAFIKIGSVHNYISIWNARKPSENCFLAGSCFLVEADEKSREKLQNLQKIGIGERCHEGFGRMCLGWQREKDLSLSILEPEKPKVTKPEEMPETVKLVVKDIIYSSCMSYCRQKALTDLAGFSLIDSKHLVAKLESWVYSGDNQSFLKKLDQLKDKAKKKLKSSYRRNDVLWDFIREASKTVGNDIWDDKGLEELVHFAEKADIEIQNDKYLQQKIFEQYFGTFFAQMRKKIKEEK